MLALVIRKPISKAIHPSGGANNGWAPTRAYVVSGIAADYVNAK